MERDYTSQARKYSFKYPILTSIGTQVNFWVIAFMVLFGILHNYALFVNSITSDNIPYAPGPAFLGSFITAIIFGTVLGLSDHFVFKKWNPKRSIGLLILTKGAFYIVTMALLFTFMQKVFFQNIMMVYFFDGIAPFITDENSIYFLKILMIYTLAMGLVISFITQINKKYGPGVLIPILLGKYINPQKEERVFIFLDLAHSTTLAEKLGHIKYSELIRDCFLEINSATIKYQAEIYQYVGDEIVLSWLIRSDFDRMICIDFYFECMNRINLKSEHFIEDYGEVPFFKAGLHEGWVTGVEVGNVKRELAFHGDTLNVAARLQEQCKVYNSDILISKSIKDKIEWNDKYDLVEYKDKHLNGRTEPITFYQVKK